PPPPRRRAPPGDRSPAPRAWGRPSGGLSGKRRPAKPAAKRPGWSAKKLLNSSGSSCSERSGERSPAVEERSDRVPVQGPAVERRVLSLAAESGFAQGHRRVRVEDGHVRRAPPLQAPPLDP